MILHWHGGDHSVLRFLKRKIGQHRYIASEDLISLVRELARVQPDSGIAAILNRLGRRTGRGHTWTEGRVRAFRGTHDIAVYLEGERLSRGELTLEETAGILKVSTESVRRLIARKMLVAKQACTVRRGLSNVTRLIEWPPEPTTATRAHQTMIKFTLIFNDVRRCVL